MGNLVAVIYMTKITCSKLTIEAIETNCLLDFFTKI